MVFPATILDLKTELGLSGVWTDISSDVYQRDVVTISRGRPDEASTASPASSGFTLNNRGGQFSPRNPVGAYYGSIGRNTPVRHSVPASGVYLRLEDDTASYVSTPDSAGLSITGDTEIQIDIAPSTYAASVLASKWAASSQQSWMLSLNADGTVTLSWSSSGSNTLSATSTQPISLSRVAIKATLAVASGTVTFYTAPDISGTWVQLGAAVVVGATSVFDSTAEVEVGNYLAGAGAGAIPGMNGKVYAFNLLSGIGGTVKASPGFTAQSAGAASFADAQGNTWAVHGTATLNNRRYRFHGEMSSWPQRWDPSGSDVYVPATAAGILRRLGQGDAPLTSVMYRYYTTLTGSLTPDAYWACEDASGASSIAAAIGAPAMTVSGSPTFASDSGFDCSQALPVISQSVWTGAIPSKVATTINNVRFLLHIPAGGDTNNGILFRMYTSGQVYRFTLTYTTASGGGITLDGVDSSFSNLFTSAALTGVNGKLLLVSIECTTQVIFPQISWALRILQVGSSVETHSTGTAGGSSFAGAAYKVVIGDGTISNSAIGHVAVQSAGDALANVASQLAAFAGETAGTRFARLCGEQGIACRIYGFPAASVAMGGQRPLKLLDLLQECETADRGMQFEPRESLSLGYRTLASMVSQSPVVTLNYTSAQLADPLEPTDDDQRTLNDVTCTRPDGSSARQTLTSGTLSTQAPPNGVGSYATSAETNVAYDSQLDDEAGWILHVGTTDEPRYPAVNVDMARPETPSGAQDVDLGDYIAISNSPAWLPPGTVKQIVDEATEQLGGYNYRITWACAPESPYETGIIGDATYGRVDTDGSSLHASITSSATSMSVDITAGAIWTTAAADFPFDVLMGGEQITVTSITGSSSPQTFTITRSVNGVVKAHTAGEGIRLAYPMIVALT